VVAESLVDSRSNKLLCPKSILGLERVAPIVSVVRSSCNAYFSLMHQTGQFLCNVKLQTLAAHARKAYYHYAQLILGELDYYYDRDNSPTLTIISEGEVQCQMTEEEHALPSGWRRQNL